MKRRTFIKRAGLGMGAVSLPGPAFSASNKPKKQKTTAQRRWTLGLASYTFREFGLEETLAMTQRLALKRIALKSFHLPLDSPREKIEEIAAKVRRAGLDLYGYGVVYMKNRNEVNHAFEYAQAAGIKVIIGVPDPELLGLVNSKVKDYDIQVAIHNHGPTDKVYPTPESAYKRIQGLDRRIGLCIDIGHTQRAGIDPAESARKFADRLLDVHIKDITAADKSGSTIEIGRGIIDIPRFLQTLDAIGYTGTAGFEFEKDGKDPLPGVAESVGYVRGVLAVL